VATAVPKFACQKILVLVENLPSKIQNLGLEVPKKQFWDTSEIMSTHIASICRKFEAVHRKNVTSFLTYAATAVLPLDFA